MGYGLMMMFTHNMGYGVEMVGTTEGINPEAKRLYKRVQLAYLGVTALLSRK